MFKVKVEIGLDEVFSARPDVAVSTRGLGKSRERKGPRIEPSNGTCSRDAEPGSKGSSGHPAAGILQPEGLRLHARHVAPNQGGRPCDRPLYQSSGCCLPCDDERLRDVQVSSHKPRHIDTGAQTAHVDGD